MKIIVAIIGVLCASVALAQSESPAGQSTKPSTVGDYLRACYVAARSAPSTRKPTNESCESFGIGEVPNGVKDDHVGYVKGKPSILATLGDSLQLQYDGGKLASATVGGVAPRMRDECNEFKCCHGTFCCTWPPGGGSPTCH